MNKMCVVLLLCCQEHDNHETVGSSGHRARHRCRQSADADAEGYTAMVEQPRGDCKQGRCNQPRESAADDWDFLWNNVPESGKEELRRVVEDDELRRRAQELNLWYDLWYVAPEEVKVQLRGRWKAAKISPRVRE